MGGSSIVQFVQFGALHETLKNSIGHEPVHRMTGVTNELVMQLVRYQLVRYLCCDKAGLNSLNRSSPSDFVYISFMICVSQ